MALPQDPYMLLSVINTKLRDCYPSLSALCDDMGVSEDDIMSRLSTAGFEYDADANRFA